MSVYDLEALKKKWQPVLDAKSIETAIGRNDDILVLFLEEQFRYNTISKRNLKKSISSFTLPIILRSISKLTANGVIGSVEDSSEVEFTNIMLNIDHELIMTLSMVGDAELIIAEMIEYELQSFYEKAAEYGALKLPIAPLITYVDIGLDPDSFPTGISGFTIGLLNPIKRK